jgi:hypothetical protein
MSPAIRQGEYKYRICLAAQVEIFATATALTTEFTDEHGESPQWKSV